MEHDSDDSQFPIKEKDMGRYKSYCEGVSAALKAFDKAGEWADLLKYLQRLEKALDKDKKNEFRVVPEKTLFAKRISQCLCAALPSGVHAKALEVLDKVYGKLTPEYMARNLDVGFGLLPLFRSASIGTKVAILGIVESRFLPLGRALSAFGDSFLIAFLPGVEEPNSETYLRTYALIESFCTAVGPECFYSNLWMALLRAPHVRIAGINYLRLHLPKPTASLLSLSSVRESKKGEEDEKEEYSGGSGGGDNEEKKDVPEWKDVIAPFLPEKDTLVLQALRKCLGDDSMLVQRETLDLLVTYFRLDEGVFEEPCLHALVRAALLLVLKTESSLSRRLFAWLLGVDTSSSSSSSSSSAGVSSGGTSSDSPAEYFARYARAPVLAALNDLFAQSKRACKNSDGNGFTVPIWSGGSTSSSATISPEAAYTRYVLRPVSVLEQLVARAEIGGQIIGDVLPHVLEMVRLHRAEGSHEPRAVLVGLQEFLAILEPRVLWGHLASFARTTIAGLPQGDAAGFREGLAVLSATIDALPPPDDKSEAEELVARHYPALLVTVIELLPTLAAVGAEDVAQVLHLALKVMGRIPPSEHQQALRAAAPVFGEYFCALCESRIKSLGALDGAALPAVSLYDLTTKALVELTTRYAAGIGDNNSSGTAWFDTLYGNCLSECVPVAVLSIRAYIVLTKKRKGSDSGSAAIVSIVQRLWGVLEHTHSAFHYDAVKHLLGLERQHREAVRAELVRLLTAGGAEACRRFSLLWRIAGELVGPDDPRPFTPALFLMLDTLNAEARPELRLQGCAWLADSASKAERVVDPLLLEALSTATLRTDGFVYAAPYDTRRALYVLRLLRTLLEQDSGLFLTHLLKKSVSKDVLRLNDAHNEASPDFAAVPIVHYADLIAVTCLRYVQGAVPESLPDLVEPNALVCSTAAELLGALLERVGRISLLEARRLAAAVQGPVLLNTARAISSSSLVLQVALLAILKAMLRYDARAADAAEGAVVLTSSDSEGARQSLMSSPMFLQTLLCGVLQPLSNNVRCYWLEFMACCLTLNSCPVGERALMLPPVVDTLCSIIDSIPLENMFDSVPCSDVVAIVKTLAAIMAADVSAHPIDVTSASMSSPSSSTTPVHSDEEGCNGSGNGSGSSGSNEGGDKKKMKMKMKKGRSLTLCPEALAVLEHSNREPRPAILGCLHLILYTLFSAYGAPVAAPSVGTAIPTTIIHNKYTVQDMIFRVLEPVMKQYPAEFVRTVVLFWSCDDRAAQNVAVEILSTFESASEEVVLCSLSNVSKSFFSTTPSFSSSGNGHSELPPIGACEKNMYSFVYAYVKRTIGVDGLAASWPHFYSFMKLAVANVSSIDAALFIVKIVHRYFARVNAYDEKKGRKPIPVQERKERQDLLTKCLDAVLAIVALYLSIQSPPPPPTLADPHPEISPSNPANANAISMLALINALVPKLLSVLSIVYDDVEKLVPVHALIAHQLIPFLKYKWSAHAEAVTKYLAASCAYPFAVRAWKKDVLDVLQTQDFFEPSSVINPGSLLALWVPIINSLMSSDKMAFLDLLSKYIYL